MIDYQDYFLINVLLHSIGNPMILVFDVSSKQLYGYTKDGAIYVNNEVFIIAVQLAKEVLPTNNKNEAFISLIAAVKHRALLKGTNIY